MALYNLTGLENANNIAEITKEINILTEGILITVILGVIFIILFIRFSDRMLIKDLFIISSFITSIVSILFWAMGMVDLSIVFYPLILMVASIIVKMFTSD